MVSLTKKIFDDGETYYVIGTVDGTLCLDKIEMEELADKIIEEMKDEH